MTRDHIPATHRQCTAKAKHSGQRCKKWAMRGLDKCLKHCGLSLEAARAKSKAALVELQDPFITRLQQIAADPHSTPMEIVAAAKLVFDKSMVADDTEARIEADKVRAMAVALSRALDAVQLSEEQKERAAEVMFTELRAITAKEDNQ